jgi:alginate O-acetyltransferase complex protein AlgI
LLGWITFASFLFYAFAGHWWFTLPMLFTTTLDYWIALWMQDVMQGVKRKAWLIFSLFNNLGLLAYFKYAGLMTRTLAMLGAHVPPPVVSLLSVVLPAGISFYTFQTLSYIVDVYRGDCPAETNFLQFAAFVSFFPHLVAGPLTRHNQLIPQLRRIAAEGIRPRWDAGIYQFAIGLAKKILIADRVGNMIDPMLANVHGLGIATAWLAALGYAVQIYFDFSGYSDMAIGLGRLFDVELPINFDSPYRATSPSDFWRRWHITLSRWLRDYLYISLGGNRVSPARWRFNLLVTMTLGGLWHGANWTFAVWGLYHGLLLVGYHAIAPRWDTMHVRLQQGITFVLVCIGWVFFRAHTFSEAAIWLGRMLGSGRSILGTESLADAVLLGALITFALALPRSVISMGTGKQAPGFNRVPRSWHFLLGAVTAFALLFMNYSSKFLYFQF